MKKNSEKKKLSVRKYYKQNKEIVKFKSHLRYLEHQEERIEYARAYRKQKTKERLCLKNLKRELLKFSYQNQTKII